MAHRCVRGDAPFRTRLDNNGQTSIWARDGYDAIDLNLPILALERRGRKIDNLSFKDHLGGEHGWHSNRFLVHDGKHVFLSKRDANCRIGAIHRDRVSLAAISPTRNSSGNEARPICRQAGQICLYVARHRTPGEHVWHFRQLPAPYPAKQSVVANLVATVGMREGWGADYVRAAYRRWFQLGQETGSEPNVSQSLLDIGQNPTRVLALAGSEDAKTALTAETDAARELGIFGSPTFVVDRDYSGDDRLEDAISWRQVGGLQRR